MRSISSDLYLATKLLQLEDKPNPCHDLSVALCLLGGAESSSPSSITSSCEPPPSRCPPPSRDGFPGPHQYVLRHARVPGARGPDGDVVHAGRGLVGPGGPHLRDAGRGGEPPRPPLIRRSGRCLSPIRGPSTISQGLASLRGRGFEPHLLYGPEFNAL